MLRCRGRTILPLSIIYILILCCWYRLHVHAVTSSPTSDAKSYLLIVGEETLETSTHPFNLGDIITVYQSEPLLITETNYTFESTGPNPTDPLRLTVNCARITADTTTLSTLTAFYQFTESHAVQRHKCTSNYHVSSEVTCLSCPSFTRCMNCTFGGNDGECSMHESTPNILRCSMPRNGRRTVNLELIMDSQHYFGLILSGGSSSEGDEHSLQQPDPINPIFKQEVDCIVGTNEVSSLAIAFRVEPILIPPPITPDRVMTVEAICIVAGVLGSMALGGIIFYRNRRKRAQMLEAIQQQKHTEITTPRFEYHSFSREVHD
jgi:hypothetical protein